MCVEWDPVKEANLLPETWKYLYCFEVWHRRSIPLDVFSALSNNASSSAAYGGGGGGGESAGSGGGAGTGGTTTIITPTRSRKSSWFSSPYRSLRTPKTADAINGDDGSN